MGMVKKKNFFFQKWVLMLSGISVECSKVAFDSKALCVCTDGVPDTSPLKAHLLCVCVCSSNYGKSWRWTLIIQSASLASPICGRDNAPCLPNPISFSNWTYSKGTCPHLPCSWMGLWNCILVNDI